MASNSPRKSIIKRANNDLLLFKQNSESPTIKFTRNESPNKSTPISSSNKFSFQQCKLTEQNLEILQQSLLQKIQLQPVNEGFNAYNWIMKKVTEKQQDVADSVGGAVSQEFLNDEPPELVYRKNQKSMRRNIARKLQFGDDYKLKLSNEEDVSMVQQALKEKEQQNMQKKFADSKVQGNQPLTLEQKQELLKRGATKPIKDPNEDIVFRLLYQKRSEADGIKGVGNAAMGMQFKSIFLAQGRSNNKGQLKNNNLTSTKKVLLHLHEREEEQQKDFFQEDLYSSVKFHKDQILDERLFQVRYNQDQGVKNQQPLRRSILGLPEDLIKQKKLFKKRAYQAIRAEKKERHRQQQLRKDSKKGVQVEDSKSDEEKKKQKKSILTRLQRLEAVQSGTQLYPQNFNWIQDSQSFDLQNVVLAQQQNLRGQVSKKKSSDSLKSGITFISGVSDLDNNNKDPINNNELNLEKLSERQELEDDILMGEKHIKAINKKMQIADQHDSQKIEWQRIISMLKEQRKKRHPCLMERVAPKTKDKDEEVKFMISRFMSSTSRLEGPQFHFQTEPGSPRELSPQQSPKRTESTVERINFFKQTLRNSHVALTHTNPKSFRQDLVCTQPASRVQKNLIESDQQAAYSKLGSFTARVSFDKGFSSNVVYTMKSEEDYNISLKHSSSQASSIYFEDKSYNTRRHTSTGFISSNKIETKKQFLQTGTQVFSKKKPNLQKEGQFVPMLVFLKNQKKVQQGSSFDVV